ncbi:hypothetical protein QYE76_016870 [Lolium multiflorum]|uniref:CCHC-type domain-containing protein n=1 Tax=Lolium multiflorum TaxID=4521 RepID=A0AAD8VEW6_LOLMU|nr:hypothetical protein QYE76_016870 [Lolium multiflorum]
MTVREGSGDEAGDATDDVGGHLPSRSPAAGLTRLGGGLPTEHPFGGRFWVLTPSDDEGEDEIAMDVASPSPVAGSLRYLCRTPEEVGDRDLNDSVQEAARRAIKRVRRRQMQREAAMDFMAMEGVVSITGAEVINLAGVVLSIMCVVAWDKAAVADMVSTLAAVIKHRWSSQNNGGRGGSFQPRFRGNTEGVPARGPIDAELLHQTVQAVVAAVTAAQKVTDVASVPVSNGVVGTSGQPVSVGALGEVPQQNDKVTEPLVVQGNAKENDGAGPVKKKKEDKEACFRCKKPGHFIDDCTTPYCELCESVHHVSSACHLLQAAKPTAILHGYANEALMFFEMPCGAFKSKVENPKLAKVSVEGEELTIPEIIEYMKKIVPYEKFHWEVFHYKDNIYRVKLPSKHEVQRLKNFGSYVCPQKETVLFFDFWSSVEEPLYMLPEVWVRVDGVPSDMRSDYLSLWGIGSLFGKTLDVDMAFTRKNKRLRIKIGCLDRNLIPADSDVFIRRGFYKLRFEVETRQIIPEVNMTEANQDKDGGGDPNNGFGEFNGHNDMEMDARGGAENATSNKDGQVGNVVQNGAEGMQESIEQLEGITIGSLNVPLSPIGNAISEQKLAGINTVVKPILHAPYMSLNNKICADFHTDLPFVLFSSGLPRDRASAACGDSLSADRGSHVSSCGDQPSGRPGDLLAAAAPNVVPPAVQEQGSSAANAGEGPRASNGELQSVPVGHAGVLCGSRMGIKAGSSVVMTAGSSSLSPTVLTQTIMQTVQSAKAADYGVQINHSDDDEPMMRSLVENQSGLDVLANGMAPGVPLLNPNFSDSETALDLSFLQSESSIDGADSLEPGDTHIGEDMGNSFAQMKGAKLAHGCPNKMRDASLVNNVGELPIHFESPSITTIHTPSLSVVENDSVSHCPSIEEVIAFGGIPKPNMDVRSSSRLGGQPNADMPQMEKAMKMAQLRDESAASGKLIIPMHSIINIPDSEIVRRADRLGISLGNSVGEIGNSVKGIKMVEEERILTILEKKKNDIENLEEGMDTLVLSKVSTLCEDLIDDEDNTIDLDDHLDHLKPVVKVKKNRQRKVYDTNNIRKSTRKRIKKQFS